MIPIRTLSGLGTALSGTTKNTEPCLSRTDGPPSLKTNSALLTSTVRDEPFRSTEELIGTAAMTVAFTTIELTWLLTRIPSRQRIHYYASEANNDRVESVASVLLTSKASCSVQLALQLQKGRGAVRRKGKLGVGNLISNTYLLHCHHQNESALRWAAVCANLMFH